MLKSRKFWIALMVLVSAAGAAGFLAFPAGDVKSCWNMARNGFRPLATDRARRFQGKVQDTTFLCRAPHSAAVLRSTPWVDWSNYWGTADEQSRSAMTMLGRLGRNGRGIDGALLDLEYQRIELIKFNLFDNYTFAEYANKGARLTRWASMRLPPTHPHFTDVGGNGEQACKGELIRYRTLDGICNDIFNPLMGSSGTLFGRNVQFEQTFPDVSSDPHARNRHGDRLGLLQPDPQVISRVLFTRQQEDAARCNLGQGLPDASKDAECSYQKAPFFNVLAAYWIQFMTHDWFTHLEEGHSLAEQMPMGCSTHRVGNVSAPLNPEEAAKLGCRSADRIDRGFTADEGAPPVFTNKRGQPQIARAYKTFRNNSTAWWDASQIYGYDNTSVQRVKRDPQDPAKLLMQPRGNVKGEGQKFGYLPLLGPNDPINPAWAGQEAVAFPDNWSIGISFYHNLFTREHNIFVDAFREQAKRTPDLDSGLRNPADPDRVIAYKDVSPEELYQAARLVVAAEIAKIHTTEWTTQLLYDEVLYRGMNANWHGLFRTKGGLKRLTAELADSLSRSQSEDDRTVWYSIARSGSGIFGGGSRIEKSGLATLLGKQRDLWSIKNLNDVNGGVNHFGVPFNFPEEFITVYRLHPLLPDLIEFRDYTHPNDIAKKVAIIETFRGKATAAMTDGGLANWALSMGRQRLGLLTLGNHPLFMQNLPMNRLNSPTNTIDLAALDLIRDREHGIPRFNEFRRQYGLRQLTSFDDFVDKRLPDDSPEKQRQQKFVQSLRAVYGQHVCDNSKVITSAQVLINGDSITDCLGQANGTLIDNIEDVDMVVGWLAESTRPHGFAISETQFTVFIINASRRLFSDRFFTSSFRPEFYTQFGIDWVKNNGPTRMMESGRPNGHKEEVTPLKRVLLRALPELGGELQHVVNAFDPWARDRGNYYSLAWKPRAGAEDDPAFAKKK